MRKLLWLVLVALIAAAAIWYGLRVAEKSATMAVTSLLPGDTLLVVHLPDFNRTRDQWHQTDIYKIREEPAVRDFLQKPLSKIPKSGAASQNLAEFESLEPKDIFFAVTSWTNGLKLAGGFRFKGKADDAEKILGKWRAKLLAKSPEAKSEVVEYQQHQIQTVAAKGQMLATVYDENWFLAANDVAELKVILDRVDGRLKDRAATLAGDSTFSAAFKHMPASYSSLIYGRVDRYLEKMAPLLGASGANEPGNTPIYRQIHAFCGALTFDDGKIRDVLFIGMPQLVDAWAADPKFPGARDKGDIFLSRQLPQFTQPDDLAIGCASQPGPSRGDAKTGGCRFKQRHHHAGVERGVRAGTRRAR